MKRGFIDLARWKKVVAVLALVLIVGGAAWRVLGGEGEAQPSSPFGSPFGATQLVDGAPAGSSTSGAAADAPGDTYGPALMKVGLGFLIGLSIGVFLRASLRLALVFFGLFALGVFGLEQLGVVEVQWERANDGFEQAKSALGRQFESFKGFLDGHLPGGGAAVAGLFSGFRRG